MKSLNKNALKTAAVGFVATLFSVAVLASENPVNLSAKEADFLTINTVTITPVTDSAAAVVNPCWVSLTECPASLPTPQIDNPITTIGNIVALGMNLWKIVEAGKPSAHVVSNSVSALPKENPHWTLMTNWQGPMVKSYHLEALNKLGFKVVSMDYRVMAYYGGKYKDKGQFITNLTMFTDNVSVFWGYDLQATAQLMDLVNTGDDENPVPGVTLQMKWRTDTALQHREGSHAIFIKGDGTAKDLN